VLHETEEEGEWLVISLAPVDFLFSLFPSLQNLKAKLQYSSQIINMMQQYQVKQMPIMI